MSREHIADVVMRTRIEVVEKTDGKNRWLAYLRGAPDAAEGETKEKAVAKLIAGFSPGMREVTWADDEFGQRVIAGGPS